MSPWIPAGQSGLRRSDRRSQPSHAAPSTPEFDGLPRSGRERPVLRSLALAALVLVGCADPPQNLEVDLSTQRLQESEVTEWAAPSVQSGQAEITVRHVFTAQGPCRVLHGELMPRYPGEFLVRVVAEDQSPCSEETPHIGYTAVLRGLPEGSHQLRVVHVGADGTTLAQTALEHPILVTGRTGEPPSDP